MGTNTRRAGATAVALLCAAAVAGCSGGGGSGAPAKKSGAPEDLAAASATASASPSPSATAVGKVSARSTSLGKILVDGEARTLYLFEADKQNKSTCTGDCVKIWPPLIVTGKPEAGTGGVKGNLLSTTTRDNGAKQATYNGHPLYRFTGDHKPGDTNGQGDVSFHDTWYVLGTSGKKNTTPQQNTGGGY
ncbi:hypothetical protein OIE62_03960 [Streptomyces scopuliridis]|uniref:Lipoprotein n=2 Tax=Streptomyces scopuliridis TaxID=452529 RepID=A0A2T7SSQ5_9ACTN|nr:hypothetical protein [Streptomyces scopuliridis]PVE05927.1 hypothetical protein Y717_33930 [Streptomyces scopuliridis RB72]WSC02209.1 hypothetical protein OG835_37870 [Streptomyces scopuliridis]WSC04254.1 hypothetical protein OIE62_03960 [Streptomyces scopuliridis]